MIFEIALTITGNFGRFEHLNFETNFLKNKNFFQKTGVPTLFQLKVQGLKTQHFHTKLSCQKLMLRQMEWGVQDDYFSFAKILFQFKNLE